MIGKVETIREELERVRKADAEKRLRPEAVVEYARKHKSSALHQEFTWDDSEAANLYRLRQARDLIRVSVTIITPPGVSTVVSVSEFVSLSDARGKGYENITDVMEDTERSEVLLHDVIKRLLSIKEVALFEELLSVHKAIQRAAALHLPKEKEKKVVEPRVRVEARV